LLQRRRHGANIAFDEDSLDAGSRAAHHRDIAWRYAYCSGDQAGECAIRLAFAGYRGYARPQHSAPVGQAHDPVNRVAACLGRESHGDNQPIGGLRPGPASLHRSISQAVFQIADYDHPNEDDDQEKNNKRDIDAAEIRKQISYRFQQRFCDSIEEIADDRHHGMAGIHHVEYDQPAQDC
jgi:hypothetical protein